MDEKSKKEDTEVDLEAGRPLPVAVAFAKPCRVNRVSRLWCNFKRRCATAGSAGAPPSSSLGDPTTTDNSSETASEHWRDRSDRGDHVAEEDDTFEAIVVENTADPDKWGSKTANSRNASEYGTSSATPGCAPKAATDASSLRQRINKSVGHVVSERVWPHVKHFFYPRYPEKEVEEAYQRELWWSSKRSHLYGASFFVLNWLLQVATLARPWSLWLDISNYGLSTIICGPLIFFVIFDWPRKHPSVWQIWMLLAVWIASSSNLIDLKLCDYYGHGRQCAGRDFISLLFYGSGPPAIALLAMGQNRLGALVNIIVYLLQVFGMIVENRPTFTRNIINLMVFYAFLLTMSFQRDSADRRMFTMRAELKTQFRAKQRAEISERKIMDSKRRLLNYVLHEVRVPLNTGMLAYQNLVDERQCQIERGDKVMEWQALEGSLQMMSGVLNDILDFNRMERGSFGSVPAPFSLHKMMQSIFTPLQVEANNRGLSLCTSLDQRIDSVAKRAAYPECAAVHANIGDGIVIGDEMRLRQILNNLSSNALKFTEAGGKLTLTTTLIHPVEAEQHGTAIHGISEEGTTPSTFGGNSETTAVESSADSNKLSVRHLERHNSATQASELKRQTTKSGTGKTSTTGSSGDIIVIRFEVTDTGSGLKKVDMADNRLFSPYVQSDNGKKYGGKGSGLGLSIVRQIVLLSGGRLGVKSKYGAGSTFWFEMPYRVGPQAAEGEFGGPRRDDCGPCVGTAPLLSPDSMMSASTYSDTSEYKHGPPSLMSRRPSDGALLAKIEEQVGLVQFAGPETVAEESLKGSQLGSASQTPLLSATSPALTSSPLLMSPPLPTSSTLSSGSGSTLSGASKVMTFEGGPLHVLVVDDDALTRKLMSRLLTRLGCIVKTAENGAVALEYVLERKAGDENEPPFHIIFLDNQMPVMTGLQTVAKLRALGRDDLVVGVTANALTTDQDEYLGYGASAVLTKPVSEKSLRHHLTLAAEKRTREANAPALTIAPASTPATGHASPLHSPTTSLRSSLATARPALPRYPSEALLSTSIRSISPKPSPPI